MSNPTNHTDAQVSEKTPYEMWTELRDMVLALEKDAQKATRGMKAGGVRLRTKLQEVREHCVEMRKTVLEYRSTRRTRGGNEEPQDEAVTAGEAGTNGAEREIGPAGTSEASMQHFAPVPGENSWFEAGSSRHPSITRSA